jgi:hypothetical protein
MIEWTRKDIDWVKGCLALMTINLYMLVFFAGTLIGMYLGK